MDNYQIKLKLCSSLITPLESDTIFGHLCWAIRFIKGENILEEMLKSFENEPPFLISDGFLEGSIVKPLMPDLEEKDLHELFNDRSFLKSIGVEDEYSYKSIFIKSLSKIKEIKNQKEVPLKLLSKTASSYNQKTLIKELLKTYFSSDKNKRSQFNVSITQEIIHNTIDRIPGIVSDEGNLFSQNEKFFNDKQVFTIYLKIFDKSMIQILNEAFSYLSSTGYGKDKSTGKGIFKISEEINSSKDLDDIDNNNGNCILSLSSFVLDRKVKNIFYDLKTKYGKQYMKIDFQEDLQFNPFKKPLIMMAAGSVLVMDDMKEEKIIIGRLINNLTNNKKVKTYAYLYPLRLNII